jgi:hypothetical protein
MKKWFSFIFFLVLLFPATSHAGISPVQKCASVFVEPNLHLINPGTNEDVSRPAIETFGLAALPVITNQPVSQNTNSFQDYNGSQVAFDAPYLLSVFFLPVEMFGNNRLSYNYPSHNFW